MGQSSARCIDHSHDHRARAVGAGLERPEPVLGNLACQQEKAGACSRERGRRLAGDFRSRRADDGQRAWLRGEGSQGPRIESAAVDHYRVRERARRACQQRQCESELAARPAAGEKRNAAARQATDPGEVIDRRSARPWLRWRQLGRPGQRLAAKADPNRINRNFEVLCLHLSWGLEARRRGEVEATKTLSNTCSRVKRAVQLPYMYEGSCSDSPDGPTIG